jgi:hypothetical protein
MPAVKGKGCGGPRPGAGQKKDPNAAVFVGARVPKNVREWLSLWGETDTKALNYLCERGMKFWPDGPHRAGATKKRKHPVSK